MAATVAKPSLSKAHINVINFVTLFWDYFVCLYFVYFPNATLYLFNFGVIIITPLLLLFLYILFIYKNNFMGLILISLYMNIKLLCIKNNCVLKKYKTIIMFIIIYDSISKTIP